MVRQGTDGVGESVRDVSGSGWWAGEQLDNSCCCDADEDEDKAAPEDVVAHTWVAVLGNMSIIS